MKGEQKVRDVVFSAVRPLILGDGRSAREVAWRFFASYSVRSTVMDKKCSLGSLFCPFLSFRRLPPTDSDEFILMSLERFAEKNSDMTVILIPTGDFYRGFTERNLSSLEARFIIRSADTACNVTPSQKYKVKD